MADFFYSGSRSLSFLLNDSGLITTRLLLHTDETPTALKLATWANRYTDKEEEGGGG